MIWRMIQYFMSPLTSLLRQRIAGRQNTRQIYRGNDLVILVRGLGSTTLPPQETRIIDKTKVSSFVSASLLYRTGERQFMAEDLLVIVAAFFSRASLKYITAHVLRILFSSIGSKPRFEVIRPK